MAVAYNPTPIDWSQLATMGQNLGGALGQHNLGTAMKGAIKPDGTIDYDKMSAIFAERQPTIAAKMAISQQEAANRYGLNLVFDENGNAYQPMTGGGLAPVSGEGGAKLAAPQTWKETPEGYRALPSRGAMGGHEVHSVPTVEVLPDGTTRPTQPQSGAVPSLGSAKYQHERAETKATDKALATNTIDKLNQQIYAFRTLVDEQGKSTPALRSVTGNRKILGVDTTIPNDWLADYSQEARNASAAMATSAIQVGLNTLEQMRAMSAQGASGMGQLAIQESLWLQNSIASLSKAQSPEEAAKHIQDIINRSQRVETIVRTKYRDIYREELPNSGPQIEPQGGASGGGAVDWQSYFGGQ